MLTTALIVEDSVTTRKILCGFLKRAGFRTVDEAEDGTSALDKLKTRSYGLILSDWHMAPMGGAEFLKSVRANRALSTVRFIFLTSESKWGSQANAKLDGADAYLVKPFKEAAMLETIERLRKLPERRRSA